MSETSSTDSCESPCEGASESAVCLADLFLEDDVGADFLCLFVCVGVSSDSSSRFPAAFLVELRGVGVGAPGVSVPPRVVTIASSLLWVDTRRVRTATVLVVAALVDRAMWKRFWRAKISRPLRTPETSGPGEFQGSPYRHSPTIEQSSRNYVDSSRSITLSKRSRASRAMFVVPIASNNSSHPLQCYEISDGLALACNRHANPELFHQPKIGSKSTC